jgi:hypothetical protein
MAADRIGGALMAARGQVWPLTGGQSPADLYFNDTWTATESSLSRRLRVSYLYVDERWAGAKPHLGFFYSGEARQQVQPSLAALTKFATVPGITTSYSHGPIHIYNLRQLTGAPAASGLTHRRAGPGALVQIVTGLMLGLGLALGLRSGLRRHAATLFRDVGASAGWPVAWVVVLAMWCLLGMVAYALTVPLTPYVAGMALAVGLVGLTSSQRIRLWRRSRNLALRTLSTAARRPELLLLAAWLVVSALAVGVSAWSAGMTDVTAVRNIQR